MNSSMLTSYLSKSSQNMKFFFGKECYFWIANSMNKNGCRPTDSIAKVQSTCWKMPGLFGFGPSTTVFLPLHSSKGEMVRKTLVEDRGTCRRKPTPKKKVWPPQDLYINAYCIIDLSRYCIYITSWSFQSALPSHLVSSSCSNSIKAGNFLSHFSGGTHDKF